jgi:hypothetical protein
MYYCYGFTRANEQKSLGPVGIEGADVTTLSFKDVAAVISRLPATSFDSLPKETLLTYLTNYQSVLEIVLRTQQIVPIKFGTILEGEGSVQTALAQGYDRILAGLREMENRIELNIVARWPNLDTVLAEIGEQEGIKALTSNAAGLMEEERFALRLKVGKRVKAILEQRRELLRDEIMDAILPHTEAHRVHPVMDDSMIMNLAVLIQKDRSTSLEAHLAQVDQRCADRINFRIIGPLPPYNFLVLEIRRMDYDLLDKARKTLELPEASTIQEIRAAYRKLTKMYHPDRFPGDPMIQKHFERINEAYKMVSEYCSGQVCSFREEEVKRWVMVQPVEVQRPIAEDRRADSDGWPMKAHAR